MHRHLVISDDRVHAFLAKSLKTMLSRDDMGLAPGERGRLYAWYWGYYGRAAIAMFKATGEHRFLHLVRDTTLQLLELRDDRLGLVDESRGRVVRSWGTRHKSGPRSNEITTAGLIALPMAQYVAITDDSAIKSALFEVLDEFLPEAEHAGEGAIYFKHRSEGGVEALNHAHAFGAALAHASILTSASRGYAEMANGIYRYFLRYVRSCNGILSWPYAPKPDDAPGSLPPEAIWKAAATIELPVALHQTAMLDSTFTVDDYARMITGHPIIARGDIPQFIGTERMMPVGEKFDGQSLVGCLASWLMIDDRHLHETIANLVQSYPARFPKGWFGGSRCMILGYAHLRLYQSAVS